jgi:hypothetical protein
MTIIASAGTGPNHGLLGASLPRVQQPSIKDGSYTLVDVGFMTRSISRSKWNTRGWAFQEGLLSKRRLVFADEAVYFQCSEMHCYGNLSKPIYKINMSSSMAFNGDRVFDRIFPVSESEPIDLINRITEFFIRDLSCDENALNALAEIFAEFCSIPYHRIFTLSGLPIYPQQLFQAQPQPTSTGILALALCWGITGGVLRRRQFPSWTFAGWKADTRPERMHLVSVSHFVHFKPLDILVNWQDSPLPHNQPLVPPCLFSNHR